MANTNLTALFTSIADALREKGGTEDKIKASDFAEAIENLPSGGGFGNFEVCTSIATDGNLLTFYCETENPVMFILFATNPSEIVDVLAYKMVGNLNTLSSLATTWIGTGNSKAMRSISSTPSYNLSDGELTIKNNSASYLYATDVEYTCLIAS